MTFHLVCPAGLQTSCQGSVGIMQCQYKNCADMCRQDMRDSLIRVTASQAHMRLGHLSICKGPPPPLRHSAVWRTGKEAAWPR
eukprot:365121-Chlamydomonas_euryale.AAC.6